jgi:localization factor PodJL
MNSRVPWSVDGIDPSVRERAEAAARRAGMSLSDWLNSTLGDTAPPNFRSPPDQGFAYPSQETRDVADIHQRLDSITRQIEQISRPAPRGAAVRGETGRGEPSRGEPARGEPGVARQLNDAISRLDARLSQISNPAPARQAQLQNAQRKAEMVERAAAQVYRPSPPLNPGSLDFAIAEITARQSELDGPPRQMPSRQAPPMAPAMSMPMAPAPAAPAGPDFSSLERHLFKITNQIDALRRPDVSEQTIAGFRSELAEIRHAITEAMPRKAIESIENEVRSLSRRIDDTRQSGIDDKMLAGIERALSEIREALRSLTPAEQLAGYDEAIRNLGGKLDLILRANSDPSTVHQLEGAIAALRSIVSNVASNDALVRLSDDVQMLSSKVDQLGHAEGHGDAFAILEQRISALTSTLESREPPRPSENSEHLEGALRTLSDRIDRMPVGTDNASAFAHLEQRVSYLLERLEESTSPRAGNLGRVEEALQDVLQHLESQHRSIVALAETTRSAPEPRDSSPADSGLADIVKRELSDIRFSQSEAGRSTQDSLEAVHNTLGHVVDRLAMIESDLRTARSTPAPAVPAMATPPAFPAPQPQVATPRAAMPPQMPAQPKPELPNPVATEQHFASAPREFHAAEPPAPASVPAPALAPAMPPRAISEILEPHTRAAIEPGLPPDHPLEPGTRPAGRTATPSERIAASETVISEIPASAREPTNASSFIAAARRAAQAAQAQAANDKAPRPPKAAKIAKLAKVAAGNKAAAGDAAKEPSTITSKIRSLLVGASVVVIVLGTFKMAMTLLDSGNPPQMPAMEDSSPAPAQSPTEQSVKPVNPAPAAAPSPVPGKQSLNAADTFDTTASVPIPSTPAAAPLASPLSAGDITGSIPSQPPALVGRKLTTVSVPPTEKLPDAIGGPNLRAAALKGDPTAAYEIGVRFAEGKGIAANAEEAAKWYDRAAQAGAIPAIFRLGTFYEKGLGVKKDADIARRYYMQAAERGNAKAMHNLAVLEADGGGKGANYKSAAQWFRKAADRGVADSEFNLGILYARGIGVEQNLAESFKWFSLAAAQGDVDSGRKRDDIAKRLDAQSLAAAKLAIQTFMPEPQPDDAINVATPAGGWDSAPVQAATPKPAAKPVKRAAIR